MSSKRKKNDNSDEESDGVNWEKEYWKKVEQLTELEQKLETKDEERKEMAEKNRELEWKLKHVNDELLRSKSKSGLSARGVIEWLEKKQRTPDSVRRGLILEWRGVTSASRVYGNASYEISDDLQRRTTAVLERRYDIRDRAHRAATIIQRAYRHYKMSSRFKQMTNIPKERVRIPMVSLLQIVQDMHQRHH
ncbi:unnamed protein product, partial [Mesorhabditis belari]|uniref:Uncharacterized protein n=1 Tax=Mesorhabditis belari TaxID=2138241 RepID=A0AAF3F7Q9_9BILA